ncbi:MAG: transcription antitermination factor NusB [Gammaproteobacteria bacterium]|nr:transcription antitermination factor NusB [Gammaproteobacteria bacterium]
MARGRRGARRLVLQALYQHQLAGHDVAELAAQFSASKEFRGIDAAYFHILLGETVPAGADLDALIAAAADRPVNQLDPVERAVLWIGLTELRAHPDVPGRVVIDEAVELAKEFGAQDSFRYINAVLDSMSRRLRPGAVPAADG